MTEQAKVPAIRFAGFTDPWEQRKLGELEKDATLYMGRGRVISAKDMSNTPGTFPVYSSSALDNGRMGAYGKYMFNQELITWSIDGGGAVFYRRKHRFSVTNVSGYIAVNPEKINCKFLAYAMSLAHSRIKFDYTVKAHPSVIRSLYTMGIPISLQEQQVIGSFFSRLDNLITLHQRKYDKLVVFKKTMLEKMFPKDGESVPEIRFAGFTDPWEQCKLGDVATRVTRKNEGESDLPLTISAQHGLVDQRTFFNNQVASKDMSGYYLLRKGEFAYNKSTSGDSPWGAVKRLVNYEKGCVSTLYICFGLDGTDPNYLVTYYETDCWHKGVQMIAAEGARNHGLLNIAPNDFFDTVLALPSSQEEQRRVGSFFSRLDDLITLHQRKLELLQNIKKSLLDKMFV